MATTTENALADLDHPGLRALHDAIDALSASERWLRPPDGVWLPEPEVTHIARTR